MPECFDGRFNPLIISPLSDLTHINISKLYVNCMHRANLLAGQNFRIPMTVTTSNYSWKFDQSVMQKNSCGENS